jgi:hypothetical protein
MTPGEVVENDPLNPDKNSINSIMKPLVFKFLVDYLVCYAVVSAFSSFDCKSSAKRLPVKV